MKTHDKILAYYKSLLKLTVYQQRIIHYSFIHIKWYQIDQCVKAGFLILLLLVPEPNFDPSIANCDFEEGLCHYYQERVESKVWNRVSVKPNAYRVGDHTTGTGESDNTKLGAV